MKNKVLKLAKRLGKFTVDEIVPLLMITKDTLMPVLGELVAEKRLIKREDGLYFYNEETILKPKQPLFFEFRTKEELELIKKCFCADLTCVKTALIMGFSHEVIGKFNRYFRNSIYENQIKVLKDLYAINPKTPRIRKFFDIPVYFYFFNEQTYVSNIRLKTSKMEKPLGKTEDKEFRKTYLKLTRKIIHNTMEKYLYQYIAEELWRMDKSFSELYNDSFMVQ